MKFLYGIMLILVPIELHAMARLSMAETRYLDLVQEHLNEQIQLRISASFEHLRKHDYTTSSLETIFKPRPPDNAYKLTLHQCEKTRLLARSEAIKKELQKDINEHQRTSLMREQTFANERLEELKGIIADLTPKNQSLIVKPDDSDSDSACDLTESEIDEQEVEIDWGPILTEQPKPVSNSSVSAGKENKKTQSQEKKAERIEQSKPVHPRITRGHIAKPLSKQCKQKSSTKILAKAVRYVACRVLR